MTDIHPEFERLSAYANGLADAVQASRIEAHIESCAHCREALDGLLRLGRETAALPRSIEPPPEVWNAVRASITARQKTRIWRGAPWMGLAAAAVLLVVLSSAVTMRWQARGAGDDAGPAVIPAAWLATEQGFDATVQGLRQALASERSQLDAETIRRVEQSLEVIDRAIAEARAALAQDPSNATLTELLASNYRHKVELLQRATQLANKT